MATNNKINKTQFTFPGMQNITGAKYVSATVAGTVIGNNDVYTCPAGKRAYLIQTTFYNGIATAIMIANIKVSSTYYQIGGGGSLATGTTGNTPAITSGIAAPILEAGESLSYNSDTANINIWTDILEYDNTVPIYCSKLLTLSSGNNTLYTVPANKKSLTFSLFDMGGSLFNTTTILANFSTAATISIYSVPNGGSPANSNAFYLGVAGANTSYKSYSILSAGDSIVVNSNTSASGQVMWVNCMEIS